MKHGGVLSNAGGKTQLIDFSSNINPLGFPSGLTKIITDSLQNACIYPDVNYVELKKTVAEYLQCSFENVVLGNGAVEIIDNFCSVFPRTVICPPCFSEYELRANARDKEVIKIPLLENFNLNISAIANTLKENDLLILGNPNNPTGLRIELNTLLELYDIVQTRNAFLLLDEAFFEFCIEDYDSINIFKKYGFKNICIIRAATKFFGLPGIRLAYSATSNRASFLVSRIEQPWHINTFAEAAAKFIFNDKEFILDSKKFMQNERLEFYSDLLKYGKTGKIKMKPYKTHANFILLKLLKHTDFEVKDLFEQNGILIRTCSSFELLKNNHIRIAVKSSKDNKLFIKTLNNF